MSHDIDIPPREVERMLLYLGELLMKQPLGTEVELPFGTFSGKLLTPKVVKTINKVKIYSPVQYTLTFTPSNDMVFDVPDPEGVAAGAFNAARLYQVALRLRNRAPSTSKPALYPETIDIFDSLEEPEHLIWHCPEGSGESPE